jgi:hypothetical protein
MALIKFKRGLKASLPTLNEGEPGFTTDTKEVFIGTSSGNIQLGNMLKSIYDVNNSGVVDDSEKLNNQSASYYLDRANHSGTQLSNTISDFSTAVGSLIVNKANKITGGTNGNIVIRDSTGDISDSGKKFNDSGTTVNDILSASKIYSLFSTNNISNVEAHLSANQSIANNTWTKVLFDTEVRDSLSNYDNTTNYRFTASVAGVHLVVAQIEFSHNDSGYRSIKIYLNGTATNYLIQVDPNNQSNANATLQLIIPINLAISDYIEIFAFQNSSGGGGAKSLIANTTRLSIIKL